MPRTGPNYRRAGKTHLTATFVIDLNSSLGTNCPPTLTVIVSKPFSTSIILLQIPGFLASRLLQRSPCVFPNLTRNQNLDRTRATSECGEHQTHFCQGKMKVSASLEAGQFNWSARLKIANLVNKSLNTLDIDPSCPAGGERKDSERNVPLTAHIHR